jgi:hypothetical protein
MASYLIKEYLILCEKFFSILVAEKIADDDEILFGILESSLKKNDLKNKKNNNNKKEILMSGCRAILKSGGRQGQECGKKVFSHSGEEFDYCIKHISQQEQNEKKQQQEDDNKMIIHKNEYGNFVFGKSGLIIKSPKEKYVVAKEGKNGQWLALTSDDIMNCKKFHLRYKIIDLSFKGEVTNLEIIKNVEFYDLSREKPKIENEIDIFEMKYETTEME